MSTHHEPAQDGPSSSYPPPPTTDPNIDMMTAAAATTTISPEPSRPPEQPNPATHQVHVGEKRRRDEPSYEHHHDPALLMAVAVDARRAEEEGGGGGGGGGREAEVQQQPAQQLPREMSSYPDLNLGLDRQKRHRLDEEQIHIIQQQQPQQAQQHQALLQSPSTKPRGRRTANAPAEFSHAIKTRQQSYTRTGQACDRCKVRKIKCDALPEGCSACTTARVECFVTDRVSGRTERRGYLQEVERERERMLLYIRDLERIIADGTEMDIRPSPWTASLPPGGELAVTPVVVDGDAQAGWEQVGSVLVRGFRMRHGVLMDGHDGAGNHS